jgi:hypothetical protein
MNASNRPHQPPPDLFTSMKPCSPSYLIVWGIVR